jgi:hypothetical protein
MTTVANTGSTSDPYPPSRFDMVGHWTGDTFVVPPPTAPAGSAAPVSAAPTRPAGPDSGWTGGRMVVLVPGSLLALLGLATLERRRQPALRSVYWPAASCCWPAVQFS